MRMKLFASLMLASTSLAMAVTPAANAAIVTGVYVSGAGGYDLTQTQHAHFSPGSYADGLGSSNGGSAQLRHQNGYTGFVSAGYGFGNGLRAEIEGDYFYSQVNHLNKSAGAGKTYGGDRNYGAFVNVLYDIDLAQFGIESNITPYVGVGAGYLWSAQHGMSTHFANGQVTNFTGTRGGFGYQGIVGMAYNVDQVPGLAVTADYRMVGQAFYNGAFNSNVNGRVANVNYDPRFNHQFTIGLRYAFDTAPPAPQAEPAPVESIAPVPSPARLYLVFFDWDKSDLTQHAHEIIARAAQASVSQSVVKIDVNGYTDSSALHPGPRGDAYNKKLSLRRADAVKAELVKDGVPESGITIHGYGDTKPLLPTGPNVREPQNRRVEINLL